MPNSNSALDETHGNIFCNAFGSIDHKFDDQLKSINSINNQDTCIFPDVKLVVAEVTLTTDKYFIGFNSLYFIQF